MILLIDWFKVNHLSINSSKTVGMLFSRGQETLDNLSIEDLTIKFVPHTKFLGLWIDSKLNWKEHTNRVCMKLNRNMNPLKLGKNLLNKHAKKLLYFAQIQSHINYGLVLWGNMSTPSTISRLQKIQNKCVMLINKDTTNKSFKSLGILKIKELIELENCKFGFRLKNNDLPKRILDLTTTDQYGQNLKKKHRYNTRRKIYLNKPLVKTNIYKKSILHIGTGSLETLKMETKGRPSMHSFIKSCKKEFWDRY